MAYGIERLNLYTGVLRFRIADLAAARGLDPAHLSKRLMCDTRSLYPPVEDSVTLAVNAAQPLLTPRDRETIELLITATESAVDFGKPVASWVHRLCGLAPTCRTLEVKNACYGCTGGLKLALAWLASGAGDGKKALVIGTDLTRPALGLGVEPIAGGCAVALLVGGDPTLATVDPNDCGYWAHEIADTFRPTAREECINDQTSLGSYLDALEGSFASYRQRRGEAPLPDLAAQIYHAPFPGMTRLAHRTLFPVLAGSGNAEDDYRARVLPGLRLARKIGTCYGSSTFVSLAGLLTGEEWPDLAAATHDKRNEGVSRGEEPVLTGAHLASSGILQATGEAGSPHPRRRAAREGPWEAEAGGGARKAEDTEQARARVSVFSYGSGCQGEFYTVGVGAGAPGLLRGLALDERLEARLPVGLAEYEELERSRDLVVESRQVNPWSLDKGGLWAAAYRGKGLLVLDEVKAYERHYRWS